MNNTALDILVEDSYTKINDTVICNLIGAGVRSDVNIDAIYERSVLATGWVS